VLEHFAFPKVMVKSLEDISIILRMGIGWVSMGQNLKPPTQQWFCHFKYPTLIHADTNLTFYCSCSWLCWFSLLNLHLWWHGPWGIFLICSEWGNSRCCPFKDNDSENQHRHSVYEIGSEVGKRQHFPHLHCHFWGTPHFHTHPNIILLVLSHCILIRS